MIPKLLRCLRTLLPLPLPLSPLRSNTVLFSPRAVAVLERRRRPFSSSASPRSKNLPPRPKPPPEEEIEEFFLKGSGPGGQKINKTNSAVQLRHTPTGIVVKSQATRSRSQNRTIARQLLADRLDDIARGDQSRSAVVGEVKRKKKASSAKKSRRKYRKLEEQKGHGALEGHGEKQEHFTVQEGRDS
ncbi:RF-1 domain-containing protein [Xylariaceae sp. FL0662B]|nr:RF-1 domain-containing protein [Xylariaceae sp. FL0662B]